MRHVVPLVALATGILAASARAEPPSWKFDEVRAPVRYRARLEHEEKGDRTDKLSLELTLELTLKAVTDGDGSWELGIRHLEAERVLDGEKHAFDSRAKKRPASPAVRRFAELAGTKIDLAVSKSGEIKSVSGALSSAPSAGVRLAEGADPDKLMAEALLGEIVAKLFRLPGARGCSYGEVCRLGRAAASCHLSQELELTRESPTRHGQSDCVKREWTTTLECNGSTIHAGGATLTLKKGKAGSGNGKGVYAPGCLVSLEEKVEYEMPTPTRTAKFKRSLAISTVEGS